MACLGTVRQWARSDRMSRRRASVLVDAGHRTRGHRPQLEHPRRVSTSASAPMAGWWRPSTPPRSPSRRAGWRRERASPSAPSPASRTSPPGGRWSASGRRRSWPCTPWRPTARGATPSSVSSPSRSRSPSPCSFGETRPTSAPSSATRSSWRRVAARRRDPRRRELAALYRQRAVALEEAQTELARQAVTLERLRIARELHDIVAHSMSVIAVQAGTGRLVVDDDPGPGPCGARGHRAPQPRSHGRDAPAARRAPRRADRHDARSSRCRRSPTSTGSSRGGRGRRRRSTSGSTGTRRPLVPGAELAAYRIVQEALTNVRRHAPGATAHVELAFGDRGREPHRRQRPARERRRSRWCSGRGRAGRRSRDRRHAGAGGRVRRRRSRRRPGPTAPSAWPPACLGGSSS